MPSAIRVRDLFGIRTREGVIGALGAGGGCSQSAVFPFFCVWYSPRSGQEMPEMCNRHHEFHTADASQLREDKLQDALPAKDGLCLASSPPLFAPVPPNPQSRHSFIQMEGIEHYRDEWRDPDGGTPASSRNPPASDPK